MNNLNDYGSKYPEASGYFAAVPIPDVWTWKGYKRFGWWKHFSPILSVICTIFAAGFICGVVLASIITYKILGGIQ